MPTTFNWIYLGQSATSIDQVEGNSDAERASLLNNTTWGSNSAPLFQKVTSVTTIDRGGVAGVLDTNNLVINDRYSTDIGNGVQTLTHDAAAVYTILITYGDGTTATTSATVAQSTGGHLFLAPPPSIANPALTAKPIATVRLIEATTFNDVNFLADRTVIAFDNGVVEGTAGNDLTNAAYVEPVANGSDVIEGADGLNDIVRAGTGNDTVQAGLGNDSVLGEGGNDSLDGGEAMTRWMAGPGSTPCSAGPDPMSCWEGRVPTACRGAMATIVFSAMTAWARIRWGVPTPSTAGWAMIPSWGDSVPTFWPAARVTIRSMAVSATT